jgi:hypothetical protein
MPTTGQGQTKDCPKNDGLQGLIIPKRTGQDAGDNICRPNDPDNDYRNRKGWPLLMKTGEKPIGVKHKVRYLRIFHNNYYVFVNILYI